MNIKLLSTFALAFVIASVVSQPTFPACPTTCKSCAGQVCTDCFEGNFLRAGTCNTCRSDCSVCSTSSNCFTCRAGFWLDTDFRCTSCDIDCLECVGPYTCTKCASGYKITGDREYKYCEPDYDNDIIERRSKTGFIIMSIVQWIFLIVAAILIIYILCTGRFYNSFGPLRSAAFRGYGSPIVNPPVPKSRANPLYHYEMVERAPSSYGAVTPVATAPQIVAEYNRAPPPRMVKQSSGILGRPSQISGPVRSPIIAPPRRLDDSGIVRGRPSLNSGNVLQQPLFSPPVSQRPSVTLPGVPLPNNRPSGW